MSIQNSSTQNLIHIKWLCVLFCFVFLFLLLLAKIGPFISKQEAVTAERLYQFVKSENGLIAATQLANGNWDKICVIEGLSAFDPIHELNPPPKNILWNKYIYWDWTGLDSKLWGWVLISLSGEILVVKVDRYGLGDSTYIDFGSKIGCYAYASAMIRKEISKGGTIVLHIENHLSP